MKCYRKILCITWIAHRTNCSILNELHLPTNCLYNIVRRQKLKYFGHVTRHDGLEKTIMQGMVAGRKSRGKPIQRWEKDITDTFGTMTAAGRVAEDRHQFRRDIWAATSWRGYAPRRRIERRQWLIRQSMARHRTIYVQYIDMWVMCISEQLDRHLTRILLALSLTDGAGYWSLFALSYWLLGLILWGPVSTAYH